MGLLGFEIIQVSPPYMLGKTIINVNVGTNVTIYGNMLMSSFFPYAQEMDFPMGDIKITGSIQGYDRLLAQNNTQNTIAYFTNNGMRIYKINQSSTDVILGEVLFNTINNGGFIVRGVQIGNSTITYIAKSINPSSQTQSTNFSNVTGQIEINVVNPTNQPPSTVNSNVIQVVHGTFTTISSSAFLVGYSDPENDQPKEVKITSLPPQGQLMYNGQIVVATQLPLVIPISALNSGALMYYADPNTTTIGQVYNSQFGVSDMGSSQFTF